MNALQRFEHRLEELVTAAFARAFRSAVQPMEIAAALQREVDNTAQILSRERRLAPNLFVIDLSPADFDRLSAYGDTLSGELAAMLHEYADEQGYRFPGALSLRFQRIEDLTTGRFNVRSWASADSAAAAPHLPPSAPPPAPAPAQSMAETAVRRAPVALEVGGLRHPVEQPGLTIGRSTAAQLRIDDPSVSRRHAEVRITHDPRYGTRVSVVDLGSTNGTFVDGRRVQSADLADQSELRLGGTVIRVLIGAADRPVTQRGA